MADSKPTSTAADKPEAQAPAEPAKGADAPEKPKSSRAKGGVEKYVVTVAGITVTTGNLTPKGNQEVVRMVHGQILEGTPKDARILDFLASKSIKKHDPEKAVPTATAQMVTSAYGSADDPVLAPHADVLPTSAPRTN